MTTHPTRYLALAAGLLTALAMTSCSDSEESGPAPSEFSGRQQGQLIGDPDDPKPLVAPGSDAVSLGAAQSYWWQMTVPPSHDGLRIVASCPGECDLTVRRLSPTGTFMGAEYNQTAPTVFLEPDDVTADDQWYVQVVTTGEGTVTLKADTEYARSLTWDPGTSSVGTEFVNAPDALGGDVLYRISSQNSTWDAWRHVLRVTSGEANLYVQKNTFPSLFTTYRSETVGSDGVIVPPNAFSAAETWYIRVRSNIGAQWTLLSGDVYVIDAGVVPGCCSNTVSLDVGPEGVAYFRSAVPVGTEAWVIAATGPSASSAEIFVDDNQAPVPSSTPTYDEKNDQRMLVVPTYLTDGEYIVAVAADEGPLDVRSVQQEIRTPSTTPGYAGSNEFSFSLTDVAPDAALGYATYQLDVPVDQIAWQISVDGGLGYRVYVRQGAVPNETRNDGLSEVDGTAVDSVTQVPPGLTNGTWFVTIKGTGPQPYSVTSGNPEITEISFVNDPTPVPNGASYEALAGWRYYRVSDIESQLGTLGWVLDLDNHVPGTEIAIRKNAVPGRWRYRANGSSSVSQGSQFTDSDDSGFLERSDHEADVWYIGIYQPDEALGPFLLNTRTHNPDPVAFNGGSITITGQTSGRWEYFQVVVPPDALGWDIRLEDVTQGLPKMVIERDSLADIFSSFPSGSSPTYARGEWQSGWRWAVGTDMTNRTFAPYDPGGSNINETGRHAAMGLGSPLEPGTYYVGVSNQTDGDMTYTVRSRGIGIGTDSGGQPWEIPVVDLTADTPITSALPAREIAYYRIDVAPGDESIDLTLAADSGEAMMAVRQGVLPNSEAGCITTADSTARYCGVRRQKTDGELYYKYPGYQQETLTPGEWFVAVAAEGQAPHSNSYIGSGSSTYTLTYGGETDVLGGPSTEVSASTPVEWLGQSIAFGQQRTYRFSVPAGISSLEVRLDNKTGDPTATLSVVEAGQSPFPDPQGDDYGAADGGYNNSGWDTDVINVVEPLGVYTVVVAGGHGGNSQSAPPSAYDLRIVAQGETVVDFNGGSASVVDQDAGAWRYFRIDVPADPLGWDLRLDAVTSGEPRMVVQRESLPNVLSSFPSGSSGIWARDNWSPDWRWAATTDITNRQQAPYEPGVTKPNEYGRILTMGMGAPLEPGTYYVGVTGNGSDPLSYTLNSRGIGMGNDSGGTPWAIEVADLPFTGSAVMSDVPAREIAYYRVQVPPGATSWSLSALPSSGEAMLAVRKDHLPNANAGCVTTSDNTSKLCGIRRQKTGTEYFYKYPGYNETELIGGTYYIAVASEGQDPYTSSYIGTGTSTFEVQSFGEVNVQGGPSTVVEASSPAEWLGESVPFGQHRVYQFAAGSGVTSIEVRLENVVGDARATIRDVVPGQSPFPTPSGQDYTASEGGYSSIANSASVLNLASPDGVYTVVVVAGNSGLTQPYPPTTYDLRIEAQGQATLPFNGGSSAVVDQEINTWRYFEVEVPEGALGWDIRLTNVTSGQPRMAIRRDELPENLSTSPGGSIPTYSRGEWQSGWQWAPNTDMTKQTYDPPNEDTNYPPASGRVATMGMGTPLQPGTYNIGITATSGDPLSYELFSRGIGMGNDADGAPWAIQVQDLAFDGQTTITGLPPREVAFYRVEVPAGAESWEVQLTPTLGDAMLAVRQGALPNSEASQNNPSDSTSKQTGTRRDKAGDEYFYRYPSAAGATLTPGTWYLAVASEGSDAFSTNHVGENLTNAVLTSAGELAVAGGISSVVQPGSPLVWANQMLAFGEEKAYRFRIPPGVLGAEVRLEGAAGNPRAALVVNEYFSQGLPYVSSGSYDSDEGGQGPDTTGDSALQLVRQGDGTVMVKGVGAGSQDSTYDLVVEALEPPELAYDGGTVSDQLNEDAVHLYRVEVPTLIDSAPIAGWELALEFVTGAAQVRIRKNLVPGELGSSTTLGPLTANNAIVVTPPFLTPGTWYIEVKATTLTDYTLISTPVRPERAWAMPEADVLASTPGLTHPAFGDSGIDDAGNDIVNPISGDLGTGLGQGRWHYYRVDVPADNGGLLRTRLEALSGEPNLYLRREFVPSLSHKLSGTSGQLVDWSDTQNGTTYGLWAPENTRYGKDLEAGSYWVAVYAPSSNVRYRLNVSLGTIEDLTQDGGVVTDAELAAGDMRYYRVQLADTDANVADSAPVEWTLSLTQTQGDVGLFVREETPIGFPNSTPFSVSESYFSTWSDDLPSIGSPNPRVFIDDPGPTTFLMPPVSPGLVYYLGVYADTDATFSLASTVSADNLALDGVYSYTGEIIDTVLAAGERRLYRVDVPPSARRWIHQATHASSVKLYLQRNTVAPEDFYSSWRSNNSANSSTDHTFYSSQYEWNYPWAPDGSYYLTVVNTSGTDQPVTIEFDGKDVNTDDVDGDVLPDWWEWEYLGNPLSYQPGTDSDNDGLTNEEELSKGTDPGEADTDGDGLNDGDECDLGTDPLDGDSDDDGILDGYETDPLDPTLMGPVIELTLGDQDGGAYGLGYGTDEHPNAVEILFFRTNNVPHWVQARGWDIDSDSEVEVYLNGDLVGALPAGPDNGTGRAAIWWFEPNTLINGANRVRFVTTTPGDTWGVTELALYGLGTPLGYDTTLAYDPTHQDGYLLHMQPPGDRVLRMRTYDTEADGALQIQLNGAAYAELPAAGDSTWGDALFLVLDDVDFQAGWNVLDVTYAGDVDGEFTLTVDELRTFTATIPSNDLQTITWLFPRTTEARQAGFTFSSFDVTGEMISSGSAASASGIPTVYPYNFGGPVFWISVAGQMADVTFEHVQVSGSGGTYWDLDLAYYGAIKDSDGDGSDDSVDVFPHFEREVADADLDGVGDQFELNFFGDLTTIDGLDDSDLDAFIDLEEFADKTDPTCGPAGCPGDLCSDPIVVETFPYSTFNALFDKTDELAGPGGDCGTQGGGKRDMVYAITSPGAGTLKAVVAGDMNYLTMRLSSECPSLDSAQCFATTPTNCCGPTWELEWETLPGQTWYLAVDNRISNYSGYFDLAITLEGCEPSCAGVECGSDGCGGTCGTCDDGDACNGAETCNAGLCAMGTPPDCDDSDPCTDDSCGAGGCENLDNGTCCAADADCDDADECTVNICDAGLCVSTDVMNCCPGGDCPAEGCDETYADMDMSGDVSVTDVVCLILVNLWTLAGSVDDPPTCLAGVPDDADVTCDGMITVSDIVLTIERALGNPFAPEVDSNGDGCPDACQP